MKDIVIVGGGTAGWITALYAKRVFPNENIVLVESKDIGILGAGEGSVPSFIDLLDYLGIPISELISKTKSTIKNGIKFSNWSDKNDFYYHGFASRFLLSNHPSVFPITNSFEISPIRILDLLSFDKNYKNTEYDFVSMFSEENKVPFLYKDVSDYTVDPILKFDQLSSFSIHFDARLLANYLSDVGEKRGIKKVYGTVKEVKTDTKGDITSILIDNNLEINTDFVFDCTGFHKLFIKNHFKSEWISFSKNLPMKKAVPFFIDIDKENIPAYTEAIAMEYGWIWKIPLQHRYGCGYVYDSDFISDEDARKEIEKFLGFVPEYPRESPFIFDPGCYKEVWNNNCLAVGLSSSFVEPLEATSIFQMSTMLIDFFNKKHHIFNRNQKYIEIFNKRYLEQTNSVMEFIYFHYLTNKKNNKFWINFKENNEMPERLKEKIFLMNNSFLYNSDCESMFYNENYYPVAYGINILDSDNIKNIVKDNKLEKFNKNLEQYTTAHKNLKKILTPHSQFLKIMGGLSD
jgi:tryptophan halogenase